MKKILNIMANRLFIVAVLILLQLGLIIGVMVSLSGFKLVSDLLRFINFFLIIYIVNKQENPSYKLAWIILVLVFPLFGGLFYLMFGGRKMPKALRREAMAEAARTHPVLPRNEKILTEIEDQNEQVVKQFRYVLNNAYYPVYKNTEATYCPTGEVKFWHMLQELKKAERYIFLEYFIIDNGIMWDSILEILIEKVKQGVDVRVMYDDAGCVYTLPANYRKILEKLGIRCAVFNPLKARLVIQMNNRDHRKICVIDGKIGFVGGINLADEYINAYEKYGHWKDTAVMLKGEAVWSLTVMFLQFWNFVYKDMAPSNYDDYWPVYKPEEQPQSDGYIQPFSDSPTDEEEVGATIHFNIINQARHYVYIHTPYLIIGYEMQRALETAAKAGVDVRITVPHVPDKKLVFMVTRANYEPLLKAGVKIYEYTPGFIHSKSFVSDDEIGLCGTTNMDYRSYYLHFECGVLIYKSSIIKDMKQDYIDTLKDCREVTLKDCRDTPAVVRLVRAILNLFAPMM